MKQKGCRFVAISELILSNYRLHRGVALQACVGSWFTDSVFRVTEGWTRGRGVVRVEKMLEGEPVTQGR